ncbi:MAG: PEP-CTERM sorting domain-containing protein [Methylotenera sp.]
MINMSQIIRNLTFVSVISITFFSPPSTAATSGYNQTFDGVGNLAGWFANTTSSTVVNPGIGGNPDGHLESRRSGAFSIGAATDLAAATGDFSGNIWTAKFDISELAGTTSKLALRFRYQDSTFNGWQFNVANSLNPAWTTFSVTFDPGWTDLQAKANGWDTDLLGGAGSVSWAQTLSDVYTTELRFDGTSTLLVGIDNFILTAVPEPETYLLMLSGLGLLGVVTSRRKQKTDYLS